MKDARVCLYVCVQVLICLCHGAGSSGDAHNLFAIKLKSVTVTDFTTYPFFGAAVFGLLTSQIEAGIDAQLELYDIRPSPDDEAAVLLGFKAKGEVQPDKESWKAAVSDAKIITDVQFGAKMAHVDREFFTYDANLSVEPPKEVPVEETLEEKLQKALEQRKKYMKLRLKDHNYKAIVEDYDEMGLLTSKVRQAAAKVLSVPESSVFVLNVFEGSVIVHFTAYSEMDNVQDGTGAESVKYAERWKNALQQKNQEISNVFQDVDFAYDAVNSEPTTTEIPVNENSTVIIGPDDTNTEKNLGAIIGGIVGGMLLLIVCIVILYFLFKKNKKREKTQTKNKSSKSISRLSSEALTPASQSGATSPSGLKEVNIDNAK